LPPLQRMPNQRRRSRVTLPRCVQHRLPPARRGPAQRRAQGPPLPRAVICPVGTPTGPLRLPKATNPPPNKLTAKTLLSTCPAPSAGLFAPWAHRLTCRATLEKAPLTASEFQSRSSSPGSSVIGSFSLPHANLPRHHHRPAPGCPPRGSGSRVRDDSKRCWPFDHDHASCL
jgi:hypothetical protein